MFNKCARTFAAQVEALKKYRSTGEQSIKVQHVNVHDGGQAIVTSRNRSWTFVGPTPQPMPIKPRNMAL
jgi:hypothetical protein